MAKADPDPARRGRGLGLAGGLGEITHFLKPSPRLRSGAKRGNRREAAIRRHRAPQCSPGAIVIRVVQQGTNLCLVTVLPEFEAGQLGPEGQ